MLALTCLLCVLASSFIADSDARVQCQSNENEYIDESEVCNGKADCSWGTDEKGCSACKGEDTHHCSNDKCIKKNKLCDGFFDCNGKEDSEDEQNCEACNSPGGFSVFHCKKDRKCKPEWEVGVCDGHNDCNDGTDEEKCPAGRDLRGMGKFLLRDGPSIQRRIPKQDSIDRSYDQRSQEREIKEETFGRRRNQEETNEVKNDMNSKRDMEDLRNMKDAITILAARVKELESRNYK